VHGFESSEGRARLKALQRSPDPKVPDALAKIVEISRTRGAGAAYQYCKRFGPALRAVVKPAITQVSGARTSASTAEMILRLLSTLLSGGHVLTAAQVELAGEFLDIHGVVGAPIVMTLNGVDRVVPFTLSDAEQSAVRAAVYTDNTPRKTRKPPAPQRVRAWRCELSVRSSAASGTAERVSSVFAERGISLDSVHATPGTPASISLRFLASATVTNHLARRLARIRDVLRVHMYAESRDGKRS
jgi:hypothetical protein